MPGHWCLSSHPQLKEGHGYNGETFFSSEIQTSHPTTVSTSAGPHAQAPGWAALQSWAYGHPHQQPDSEDASPASIQDYLQPARQEAHQRVSSGDGDRALREGPRHPVPAGACRQVNAEQVRYPAAPRRGLELRLCARPMILAGEVTPQGFWLQP